MTGTWQDLQEQITLQIVALNLDADQINNAPDERIEIDQCISVMDHYFRFLIPFPLQFDPAIISAIRRNTLIHWQLFLNNFGCKCFMFEWYKYWKKEWVWRLQIGWTKNRGGSWECCLTIRVVTIECFKMTPIHPSSPIMLGDPPRPASMISSRISTSLQLFVSWNINND